MRFKMKFTLARPELPADYRRIFLSFIKKALTEASDGSYFKEYYGDTRQKDFAWAVFFKGAKFDNNKVCLEEDHITVVFSVGNRKKHAGYQLFLAFLKQKGQPFPLPEKNQMTLANLTQMEEKTIKGTSALFTTLSPLVVRDHDRKTNKDSYYTAEEKTFEEKLTTALKIQAKLAGFPEDFWDSIKVKILEGKKIVIKHYDVYLDATKGVLILEGNPLLLQHFYTNGVCSRKSEGFGLLDILAQQ